MQFLQSVQAFEMTRTIHSRVYKQKRYYNKGTLSAATQARHPPWCQKWLLDVYAKPRSNDTKPTPVPTHKQQMKQNWITKL